MAATEKTIRETLGASLQSTLFGLLRRMESCEADPEKTDEYNRAYLSNLATELLSHVGYGRQDEAERIIKKYPEILLFRPSRPVNDIAGNLFTGTAFQYALWAMDTHMYQMMLACLPPNEHGETIRKGLLEQAKVQTEHFDFKPLIKALEAYVDNYDYWAWVWPQASSGYWCGAVGQVQKALPAHVRQEYCNPDRSFDPVPSFNETVLKRSLMVYDGRRGTWDIWDESLLSLGSNFAITRSSSEAQKCVLCTPSSASLDLKAVIALSEVRTSDLSSFMQRLQRPIWKPDDTEFVSKQIIA